MDELPTSLPEIFADHLREVNPVGLGAEHWLSEDRMLKVAKVIAKTSLGEDYIPKEVTRERLEEALKAVGEAITESNDPLKRLELNGVLAIRRQGAAKLCRFALDPMAEYIGAEAIGDDCGTDREKWKAVLESSAGALGFQYALRLTLQAYGAWRGWPADL
jgi:hypothetical protein